MVKSNFIEIKYILFHAVILVLIATIPIHFYINSELNNSSIQSKIELSSYAQKVANKIYKFSNSNESEFLYPRSKTFKSAIYDSKNKEIFSLFKEPIKMFNSNLFEAKENIYLKYRLKKNIFDASFLVVSKKISHKNIVINVLGILIITSFLVLLATFFIIKQTAEPYKKLNKYLENFIKDAMHEMKTPIGVILLNLDVLASTYKNNKPVQRAKSALKNMIVVYEDLEFFVRKNVIEHPKENIDFSIFVEDRISFFMDLLNSKEIKIISNIENNIYLDFNKLELSRIIDNTISNAIKYSKNNTTISINLIKINNIISLEVLDQGRGIKDIDKIFERYYRGDKISGGFGIGLNIVKNICEKSDVSIEVFSTIGKGTTFIYKFEESTYIKKGS